MSQEGGRGLATERLYIKLRRPADAHRNLSTWRSYTDTQDAEETEGDYRYGVYRCSRYRTGAFLGAGQRLGDDREVFVIPVHVQQRGQLGRSPGKRRELR